MAHATSKFRIVTGTARALVCMVALAAVTVIQRVIAVVHVKLAGLDPHATILFRIARGTIIRVPIMVAVSALAKGNLRANVQMDG
jgi:hypothetical protein